MTDPVLQHLVALARNGISPGHAELVGVSMSPDKAEAIVVLGLGSEDACRLDVTHLRKDAAGWSVAMSVPGECGRGISSLDASHGVEYLVERVPASAERAIVDVRGSRRVIPVKGRPFLFVPLWEQEFPGAREPTLRLERFE